jgi:hypothetical protein
MTCTELGAEACTCGPAAAQEAKNYCREIVDILTTLKRTRDMSINEARLIIAIEDPRAREKRGVGIEVRP